MFARAFGAPGNIAQRFDNIVHLNAIALGLRNGSASPFQIGSTSDIGFYPNAWHALTTLGAELTGASVPVAVNGSNLAIVSILWPASVMALAGAFFAQRRTAYVVSAALSTGFGAFPALFFNWGVLYPNLVGYAMLPAALAVIVTMLPERGTPALVRSALLVALLAGGTFLGHPNAFLSLLFFAAAVVVTTFAVRAITERTRGALLGLLISVVAFAVAMAGTVAVFRTGAEHSGWAPWQQLSQSLGEGLFAAPRGFTRPWSHPCCYRRFRRRRPPPAPADGAGSLRRRGDAVRRGLGPAHRQSPASAAHQPLVQRLEPARRAPAAGGHPRRYPRRSRDRRSRPSGGSRSTRAGMAPRRRRRCRCRRRVLGGVGPNVRIALSQVHEAYAYTDSSLILSSDEEALLDRLDDETPPDALIAGSPRTGTSLALAFADRQVTQKHVFGNPSPEVLFLNAHLRDIDSDPAVCRTVDQLGVDYVLDFGTQDVIDPAGAAAYSGIQDLTPGTHLVLVDSQGPEARLFRIEGC